MSEAEIAQTISQLASTDDSIACGAYSALAGYLAEGIANIFNICDPQAVILSGGLIEGYSQFAEEVEQKVTSLLHFGSKRRPKVVLSASGQYAGVQGAAVAVFAANA